MQTADPDSLGFIPERLARIPQFLRQRYLDSGRLKGFQLLVGREGDYLGGAIAPGIAIASEALISRAAMLYRVSLERPPNPIGRNTAHSLQAGIVFGYAEMVRFLTVPMTFS